MIALYLNFLIFDTKSLRHFDEDQVDLVAEIARLARHARLIPDPAHSTLNTHLHHRHHDSVCVYLCREVLIPNPKIDYKF